MERREVIDLICEYGSHDSYIREIRKEQRALEEDIKSMRELKAVTYSDMPKGSSVDDPTARAAVKIIDIYEKRIDELERNILSIMERKAKAEELLSRLTESERKVIEARYIKGIKWDHVPQRVYLSRRSCFYHRKRAIEKMCEANL